MTWFGSGLGDMLTGISFPKKPQGFEVAGTIVCTYLKACACDKDDKGQHQG